jgi:hypothetical protein
MDRTQHVEQVLTSLSTAEAHISTEYQDDLSVTLATVTKHEPRYAMMPVPGEIRVVSDSAGVAEFYQNSRAVFQPLGLRIRTQIATDWFMFLEGVASRRARDTGEEYTTSTTTLFPTTSDGIVGEFLWERYEGAPTIVDGVTDAVLSEARGARSEVPAKAVRSLRIHDRMVQALRDNDVDRFVEPFADDFLLANRSYLPSGGPMVQAEGRHDAVGYWRDLLEHYRIEDVSIVNRIAEDWYVFTEAAFTVRARDGGGEATTEQFRTATIFPIRADGKVMGELGYGTDIDAVPSRPPRKLGIAVYGREDYADPLSE